MQQKIEEDLRYLAGMVPERSAFSEGERKAAEYIAGRLRETTPDVAIEAFGGIQSYAFLFACYLSEFLMVALISIFWPLAAFFYGLMVFIAYAAEAAGYRVLSRMLPQLRSQNVVARLYAEKPRTLFVVIAHYDSGCASLLTSPRVLPWLRPLHWMIQLCMVIVLASCILNSGMFESVNIPLTEGMRWWAVAALAAGAAWLYMASLRNEPIQGANFNASGVAVLLCLAQRFASAPLEHADICFVATGANESYMAGLRAFLKSSRLNKRTTFFLNCEGVGVGALHHLAREGVAHYVDGDAAMQHAATTASPPTPSARLHLAPTEGALALARGYRALTLIGLDEKQQPINWKRPADRLDTIESGKIREAAAAAEALLRQLERSL